ncbi:hypothetical protein TRFO_40856 [Tritrichomonas foetus]|uniref:Uncharacterized protein n=1 Tax=Tritrichomonas foetus TaxID=1144522 RepID=A0A1J4J3S8_9EUKA|nr:hypothetical protein TRFO_40856 [Tritrichomonas foetus]|eukprot:OHS92815.1 hypothetical protein TRFO_40856 [Tritrichomonas foetus]
MQKQRNGMIQKIGYFWATMVMWSRMKDKLHSLEDIYHSRKGVFCPSCKEFISSNNLTVTRHQTSAHPETRQQNSSKYANRKTVTLHSALLHNDNELAQLRNEIINQENLEIERRERRRREEQEEIERMLETQRRERQARTDEEEERI